MNKQELEIPEGWKRVKLGETIEVFDNRRIPLDSEYRNTIKGTIPYCGSTGIIDYINDYIFEGEYVLIAEDGGKYNRYEQTAYIMIGRFWANNHVHIVKGRINILNNYYLMYLINYIDISYYISGSTREKLNQQVLRSIDILLPPLPEQEKIAEILLTIDNAIDKTDKIIEKYKRIKQGLMQELLTKGVDDNFRIRSEQTHKFKDSTLGRIPEEWEVVRLGDTALRITDGKHGDCLDEENSGYYFISAKDIYNGNINYENARQITKKDFNETYKRIQLEPNDIVLTNSGTIGKIALVKDIPETYRTTFQKSVAIIKLNKCYFVPIFMVYELTNILMVLINESYGSAQHNLLLRYLKNLLVLLPSLPEQKRIASILSQIDEAIEKEQKYKAKLERIKQGLMHDLLTGKVRVNKLIEGYENVQKTR